MYTAYKGFRGNMVKKEWMQWVFCLFEKLDGQEIPNDDNMNYSIYI